MASDEVIERVRTTHPSAIREQTSDAETAVANVISCYIMPARHVRDEPPGAASRCGLAILEVDRSRFVTELAARVQQQLRRSVEGVG